MPPPYASWNKQEEKAVLKTITPGEMKRVENRVMAETTITGEALMHTAAGHVAQAVLRHGADHVLCLCGNGNNGGDGLAAMRLLLGMDPDFSGQVWILPGRLSADAQRELKALQEALIHQPRVAIRILEHDVPSIPEKVSCVIDALFGTGLSRPLEGLAAELCRQVNQSSLPVVAVDIPSGLSGETGNVLSLAIKANETVTFHRPKPGLYLGQGPEYAGSITVGDIGLHVPEAEVLDDADGISILERSDLHRLLPPRKRVSHKGSYGRVLLWAGSTGMAGAASISALAALRTGAGLVTVACPESIVTIVQILCPCATCLPLPDDRQSAWTLLLPAIRRADAVGLGCGLGQSEETTKLLALVLDELNTSGKPAVLDADALNLLAGMKPAPSLPHALLTPHPAEAARLLKCETAQLVNDAPSGARKLHEAYGASIILKGTCSVLCAEGKLGLNPYGTPAMAKGGSGDALTGVLAALLAGRRAGAYSMTDLELMQTGCALHGLAGEEAEKCSGQRGMLATELCDRLGLDYSLPETSHPTHASVSPLGQTVSVVVEHRLGSREPQRTAPYPLNCGYVQEVLEQENRWQNACIIGEALPLDWFEGQVIATGMMGSESLWLVAQPGQTITPDDARRLTAFLGTLTQIKTLPFLRKKGKENPFCS